MTEDEMLEPIKRMFIRIFSPIIGPYLDKAEATRYFPYSETRTCTRADLLYIQGRRDRIHVIESEPTIRRGIADSKHGVFELNDYKANYKWLALPLEEVNKDKDNLLQECTNRHIGLIAVYPKAGGVAAKSIYNATFIKGDFLYHWPHVCSVWNQCANGSHTPYCPYEKNVCRL